MKIPLASFTLLILFGSCVAPQQPPLTPKEEYLFKQIELKYKGKTNREIDPILLGSNKEERIGSYSLNTILNCDTLYNLGKDSLKIQKEAFDIAKKISRNIIDKDPKYDKVWVSFSCDTTNSKFKDLVFVYNIDTLWK